MHELLRNAADVDAGAPQPPLAPLRGGLDEVQARHPLPQPRCLLRTRKPARPAPDHHQVVLVLVFFRDAVATSGGPVTRTGGMPPSYSGPGAGARDGMAIAIAAAAAAAQSGAVRGLRAFRS